MSQASDVVQISAKIRAFMEGQGTTKREVLGEHFSSVFGTVSPQRRETHWIRDRVFLARQFVLADVQRADARVTGLRWRWLRH